MMTQSVSLSVSLSFSPSVNLSLSVVAGPQAGAARAAVTGPTERPSPAPRQGPRLRGQAHGRRGTGGTPDGEVHVLGLALAALHLEADGGDGGGAAQEAPPGALLVLRLQERGDGGVVVEAAARRGRAVAAGLVDGGGPGREGVEGEDEAAVGGDVVRGEGDGLLPWGTRAMWPVPSLRRPLRWLWSPSSVCAARLLGRLGGAQMVRLHCPH